MKEKYIKAKIEIKMENGSADEAVLVDVPALFKTTHYKDGQIGIASDDEDGGW